MSVDDWTKQYGPQPQQSGSWLDSVLSAIGGGATGAVKGAGSTLYGLGKLFNENSFIGGQTGPYPPKPDELTPQGTAQKVGFGGEQVAEFLVPGGASAQAGKGMGLLGKMGLEALTTGGVAAAQSGGDPVQTATAAALGAAGPLAGRALKPIADKLKTSAAKAMTQALGPTTTVMKGKAERAVPGLLERGVSGSRPGMLAQAEEGLSATAPAYDKIASEQGQLAVNTKAVVDSLEKMKDGFLVKTTEGTKAAATKGAENAVNLITDLQQRIATTDPSLESVRSLRTILGAETEKAFGKLPAEQQVTERIKDATYKALRKELQKASPDLAAVDKEYAFWSNVKDVLTATEKRTKPQGGGLLSGMASKAALAVTGLGAAYQDPKLIASGVVFGALGKVIASPAWKSWSAVQKEQLARAMAAGRFDQALQVISRGLAGASTGAQSTQAPSSAPSKR